MNVPTKQTKSPKGEQGFDLATAYKTLITAYLRRELGSISKQDEVVEDQEVEHESKI